MCVCFSVIYLTDQWVIRAFEKKKLSCLPFVFMHSFASNAVSFQKVFMISYTRCTYVYIYTIGYIVHYLYQ